MYKKQNYYTVYSPLFLLNQGTIAVGSMKEPLPLTLLAQMSHMTPDESHMTPYEHHMTPDERHMTPDEHHMTQVRVI